MLKSPPFTDKGLGFTEIQSLSIEIKELVNKLQRSPNPLLLKQIEIKVELARNYFQNLKPNSQAWAYGERFKGYIYLCEAMGIINTLFAEAQLIMLPYQSINNKALETSYTEELSKLIKEMSQLRNECVLLLNEAKQAAIPQALEERIKKLEEKVGTLQEIEKPKQNNELKNEKSNSTTFFSPVF
ncbi:hypothetical protein ACNVED_03845 [Legionella sp. D16C41]|uniref:hypothetical protein n=1 Tax=Legionella sp. D16C41 TaxID=3402688 RepID=UPI003AF89F2B